MKEIKKLEAKGKIFSLLLLNDGRLACSTSNFEILLFDLSKYTNSKISTLHSKPVTYISQLHNNNIISCSLDGTLDIFAYPSYTKIDIIKTNFSEMKKVISLSSNRFAVCSSDSSITIYSNDYPYIILAQFPKSESNSILQLKNEEILISGSPSFTVHFWSIKTYQLITTFKKIGCFDANSQIQVKRKLIIGSIFCVSIVNLDMVLVDKSILNIHFSGFSSFAEIKKGLVLCGKNYNNLMVLDVEKNTIEIAKEDAHRGKISSLIYYKENIAISGSYDTFIKVWKI